MKFLLIAIFTVFISGSGEASSIGSKVKEWFDNQNYSNITNPGVYEGQSARYATLGGISQRAPIVYPFQFAQVQTPKFSAGCGGIDFYAGGFQAIDADEFIRNLSVIAQNAKGLAYMLAFQIVTPQIKAVIQDMQTFAQKYLNMNMDSCEAATRVVGGAMDYFGAKESNCTIKRLQSGMGEDWTTANYACTTGAKIKSTEGDEPNTLDFVKGNLAWYVLMQDSFFQSNKDLAEVVMNITGTIIIGDAGGADDDPSSVRVISPAIKEDTTKQRFENIYAALLFGKKSQSSLQIYRCVDSNPNEKSCMSMGDSLDTVSVTWVGLHEKVQNLVTSIIKKIYADEVLSPEESGIISSTRIPLYRFLAATAAYFPPGMDMSKVTGDYTKIIAEDILLNSLHAVVEKAEQLAASLKNGMSETKRIRSFRKDIDGVLSGVSRLRRKNEFDADQFVRVLERIKSYEKALMAKLSPGFITNAMWGG